MADFAFPPPEEEAMEPLSTDPKARKALALYHKRVQRGEIENTPDNWKKHLMEHGVGDN